MSEQKKQHSKKEPKKKETAEHSEKPAEKQENKDHSVHREHAAHHKTRTPEYGGLTVFLIAIVAVLVLFNQLQIAQVNGMISAGPAQTVKFSSPSSNTQTLESTGDPTQDAINAVIPTGTPEYGEALGVSFDDPVTINW